MAIRRSIDFLPSVFRTATNKRFLNATVDQLIQEPGMSRMAGYVGRGEGISIYKPGDAYVQEADTFSQYYQLEPSLVVRRRNNEIEKEFKIDNVYSYIDLLNKISSNGGITDNHDRMFRQEYYNYQGFVDIEKLVNYRNYFWVPNGPDPIDVYAGDAELEKTFFVTIKGTTTSNTGLPEVVSTDYGHTITGFANDLNPIITLVRGGRYQFDVSQPGLPFYIQTEPGNLDDAVDYVSWQQNISKREVKGVDNNGEDSGSVVFNVPRKDAQDAFISLPEIDAVDFVLDLPFNQVQNIPLALFYANLNSFDGIKTNQTTKRVIFTDTSDDNWVSPGNYGDDYFDSTSFDQGDIIPQSQRKGVWQLKINDEGVIKCTYIEDLPANYKVFVNEGAKYGNRYLYKDGTLTLKLVPVITANLDTLYYQTAGFGYGEIRLIEADLTTKIVVDDIIGQKRYTSPNGIRFTNGLKVKFTNVVEPESYKNNEYVIEGVGKAIRLVKWRDLATPESSSVSVGSGYDALGEEYDSTNYDSTLNAPTNKEYITINRSSTDGNPWTRGNRWFHKDVLDYSSSILTPGLGYNFDEKYRAKRPIIEFLADLKLFNGAGGYQGPIDVIDITTTDALSQVEGASAYFVDGIQLNNGQRVVFAADTTSSVRNTIYTVQKYDRTGNQDYQIHLIPTVTVTDSDSIVVNSGVSRQGQWWRFQDTDNTWKLSQQKTSINQAPLFDVFVDGESMSNSSIYPGSSFMGSKLFSYKPGTSIDSELNIPISYRSLGNIGDILFQNDFVLDTFTYNFNGQDTLVEVKLGNPKLKDSSGTYVPRNPWTKITDPSKQLIEQKFTATLNKKNDFFLNCVFKSSRTERNVFVTLNGVKTQDFKLYLDKANNRTVLQFTNDLAVNDRVIVKIYGTPTLQKNYYTIPKNLEKNSFNDDFESITLGQMRDHLTEMSNNNLEMQGNSNGDSNLHDIDYVVSSGTILQHSAPLHIAQLLVNNPSTDLIESVDLSRREYSRFKDKFLELLINREFRDPNDSKNVVDSILAELSAGADSSMPFYYTDMLAFGSDYKRTIYTVLNTYDRTYNAVYSYGFDSQYDSSGDPYKTILVYHKRGTGYATQLLIDRDYTLSGRIVTLRDSFDIQQDDNIILYEYSTTKGCMIPATPSKLGIYPRFKPRTYLDETYLDPIMVIEGHDGSIIPAFGDFRDNALLDLEGRIYNNIRVDYKDTLADHRSAEPGAFRQTGYSFDEWTQLLGANFMAWAGENNLDIYTNNIVSNDLFSLNYSQATDKLFDELMPGYWRAIYKYFYDTDRPHTAPWEMLGFSEKPPYWESKYGEAPYTSGNLVMWGDLESGVYYTDTNGDGAYVNSNVDNLYLRPGLTSIIPVDEHGNLLPPQTSVVGRYNVLTKSNNWRFGDQGPVEAAWRRSSNYPFALMSAYLLARPAEFVSYSFNLRDYVRNSSLNQIINKRTNNRKVTSVISDDTNLVPGCNVWIRDRLSFLGLDISENFTNLIEDSTLNLAYKMSGFTDKQYLQVIAEQSSPSSLNTGILVPQENYDVALTRSAPTSRSTYSAVIIEKQGEGYAVKGFDINKPYFFLRPSIVNNNSYSININGATGTIYRDAEDRLINVPYGTYLSTKQQVVDFLISYGRYLELQGFKFQEVLTDNTTRKDWTLSVKEFLFFTTQQWDDSTVISLTPAGSTIDYDNGYAVVEDLTNSYNNTRIVNSDGKVVPANGYRVYRDGTAFQITLRDDTKGIHLIDLQTSQSEHTLVFDNITVFNDVIYQANLGNRQLRLKIVGRKTTDWNGSLFAPGFLVNNNSIKSWKSQTDYYKGDIVKHKNKYYTARTFLPAATNFDQDDWYEIPNKLLDHKLIPNPTFNSQQFEGFYDVDSQDVNVIADMQARHATGFQERQYLTDIGLDAVSQHKFYLGMIAEKGTKSSFDKFLRAKLPYLDNEISIDEEWAIRVGDYGNIENNNQIEIPLGDINTNNEIAVIELLENNEVRNPLWNTFKKKDLYYVPNSFSKDIFAETRSVKNKISKTGPVLLDEVAVTVFDVNKIENVSSYAPVMGEGSRLWIAADKDNDWNIYRASNDYGMYANRVIKISATELEFQTAKPHGLKLRDKVLVKNAYVRAATATGTGTTTDISGVYRIIAISNNRFRVQINQTDLEVESGPVRALVYKFQEIRYPSRVAFANDTPYKGWKVGDKAYIDQAVSGGWEVLENQDPWNFIESQSPLTVTSADDFGRRMVLSNNQRTMAISCTEGTGKIYIYGLDDFNHWNLLEGVSALDSYTANFGDGLDINNDNKLIVGDPGASNVGIVYVLTISAGLTDFDQAIYDPTLPVTSQFGACVAASKDGKWLYISSNGSIDAYKLNKVAAETSNTAVGDASTTTFFLPDDIKYSGLYADQVKVFVDNVLQIPYLDYDMNGPQTGVTLNTAPGVDAEIIIKYSDYYSYVDTITNPGYVNNGFGSKIVCSTDGQQIIASAPNDIRIENGVTVNDVGSVYVFQRTVENFVSDGSNITLDTYYPVNSATVIIDGVELTSADFNEFSYSIVLNDAPALSSIVSVETNNFRLVQILNPSIYHEGTEYGTDVVLCPNNCSVYVGAPYFEGASGDQGAVFRHINIPKIYGEITGTVQSPTVSVGDIISINNFQVTFTGTDLDSIIADINDSVIPGVYALKTSNNNLQIKTDSTLTFNKLTVTDVSGNVLTGLGLQMFQQVQLIESSYQEDGLSFGEHLAISKDANKLLVGTTKSSSFGFTTYDNDATSFDISTTRFKDKLVRSGNCFLYEYQSSITETADDVGQFAFAMNIHNESLDDRIEFGRNMVISDNWLMVASPRAIVDSVVKGAFYIYRNPLAEDVWKVIRSQSTRIDSSKIQRALIYDDNMTKILAELPVIDMPAGKMLPEAGSEIDFTTNYDPATYNNVPTNIGFTYDKRTAWAKEHVGKLWWDINSVKYLDWQQGSLLNKATLRDVAFPSSSYAVYEWIESTVAPVEYTRIMSSRGLEPLYTKNEVYTSIIESDPVTGLSNTKYYFWIKRKALSIETGNDRVSTLTRMLTNPRGVKVPFLSVIGSNSVALYNCADLLGHDRILRIIYKKENDDIPVHTEWSIFKDGSRFGMDQSVFNKIVDSVAEQDAQGRPVPDNNLNLAQRFGLAVRPRQGAFINPSDAKKLLHDYANSFFTKYPIRLVRSLEAFNSYDAYPLESDYDDYVETDVELSYLSEVLNVGKTILVKNDSSTGGWTLRKLNVVDHAGNMVYDWHIVRAQSYDNRLYWEYSDWYSQGFTADTIPDYQVDFSYEINQLDLRNNDSVKIRNGSSGGWQLVKITGGKLELVAQQNATIQFKTNLYDSKTAGFGIDDRSFELTGFSVDNGIEVRNLFVAFVDMLTTNAGVLVKEFRTAYNDFMSNGLALIAMQFEENDWLFKTSFLNVNHTIRNLDQIPIYVKQPENVVQQYIDEIKPYHTKIRRYLSSYPGSDSADTFTTDFDLSSYLTSTGSYKSPNILDPVDQDYLASYPAKAWTDNYTNEVGYVDIIYGGSGYNSNTVISFIGGGGTGVVARAKVSNGSIVSVILEKTGTGFITPPEVLVEGTGTGAVLIARLRNNKVRTFTSKILFDRYTYSQAILDWTPNTAYSLDDVFIYDNNPYRVIEPFVSSNQIDLINVVPYRFMRWEPRTRYAKYDLVITDWANGTVYEVASDHISPTVLTLDYLRGYMVTSGLVPVPYTGVIYDTASDRTWSYYQPASGAPGKNLAQLMSGIEYPGVKVLGPKFDQEPGFDVSNYDTSLFDNLTYDEEGLPVISGAGSIDTNYYSYFTDASLGLRPEDIITDGSGFVDIYSSHAPEELVPGIIFDALDIRVTTIADSDMEGDGSGPEIKLLGTAANSDVTFPFEGDVIGGVEKILVWTKNEGYKHQNEDFTIDYINKEIVFPTALANPDDIVYTASIGSAGENIIADLEYIGDGSTVIFPLDDIKKSTAQQVYVKINGFETTNYSLSWDNSSILPWQANSQYHMNDLLSYSGSVYRATTDFFSSGIFDTTNLEVYDYYAAIVMNVAPAAGDYIQVHVYDQASSRKAYSSIKEVKYTVAKQGLNSGDLVSYPGDYVFALPEQMQYAQPYNNNLTVRLNNEVLSPANNTYYTGDGSTTSFIIPMVGDHTAATWSDNDLQVVVNNVAKTINIDYTIYRDGSSIDPVLIFNTAPAAGAIIDLSDKSVSDYVFVDNFNIRIKSTLFIKNDTPTDLKVDDVVTIIQYSNHDMYDMRTQVFKGLTASSIVVGGFDAAGFDAVAFDSDAISVVAAPVYYLSRPVTNQDYLFVFLNGTICNQIYDYTLENGNILSMDLGLAIGANDVVTIRHYGENLRKPTLKFRVFKDMNDQMNYLGVGPNNSTKLVRNLQFSDTLIYVQDASKLMEPSPGDNQPGVIFVNGERITYWVRNLATNTLGQIRRSTGGTGGRFHAAGSIVEDGGASMKIPNGETLWYNLVNGGQVGPDGSTLVVKTDGQGLQSITTDQANYLRSISR